jgi:hypothetical protein
VRFETRAAKPSPNFVDHEAKARDYAHHPLTDPKSKAHIRNLLESIGSERSMVRLLKLEIESLRRELEEAERLFVQP